MCAAGRGQVARQPRDKGAPENPAVSLSAVVCSTAGFKCVSLVLPSLPQFHCQNANVTAGNTYCICCKICDSLAGTFWVFSQVGHVFVRMW